MNRWCMLPVYRPSRETSIASYWYHLHHIGYPSAAMGLLVELAMVIGTETWIAKRYWQKAAHPSYWYRLHRLPHVGYPSAAMGSLVELTMVMGMETWIAKRHWAASHTSVVDHPTLHAFLTSERCISGRNTVWKREVWKKWLVNGLRIHCNGGSHYITGRASLPEKKTVNVTGKVMVMNNAMRTEVVKGRVAQPIWCLRRNERTGLSLSMISCRQNMRPTTNCERTRKMMKRNLTVWGGLTALEMKVLVMGWWDTNTH